MDRAKLEKLGLNRNEAIVYIELTRLGQAAAGELIKKTGFHRNIVYDNLEKLLDKGLVSFIIEGRKKIFQIAPPDMISELLEKQQKDLDKKKKAAADVQEQIKKAYGSASRKQEATLFRGIRGIKTLLKDTIAKHTDYYVFGAPEVSLSMMGSAFWKNYNRKRIQKKIVAKMMFNEDLRAWSKQIQNRMTRIKFLPKHFDNLTETMIYSDKVAIIVWTDTPTAVLIRDKAAAKGYKQYFDILWKIAKT